MKECEEGGNEVLSSFVKILKYQEYCEWILKKDMKEAYLVLHNHDGLYAYYEGLIEESSSVGKSFLPHPSYGVMPIISIKATPNDHTSLLTS